MLFRVITPGGRIYDLRNSSGKELNRIGYRVLCRIKGKNLFGIVVGPGGGEARGDILEVPDKSPVIGEPQLEAVKNTALDYLRPWGVLLFNLLPSRLIMHYQVKVYAGRGIVRSFLDAETRELVNYLKKRGGVPVDSLKRKFGSQRVDLLLEKGLLTLREGWREKAESGERYFSLRLKTSEALEKVRSRELKRLIVFLGGRSAVGIKDLKEWGFKEKHLKDLLKIGIAKEAEIREVSGEREAHKAFKQLGETGKIHFLTGRFYEVLEAVMARSLNALGKGKGSLIVVSSFSQFRRVAEIYGSTEGVILLHPSAVGGRFVDLWFESGRSPGIVITTQVGVLAPVFEPEFVFLIDESFSSVRLRRAGDIDLRKLVLNLSKTAGSNLILAGPELSLSAHLMVSMGKGKKEELVSSGPKVRVLGRTPRDILTPELYEILKVNDGLTTLFLVPKQGYSYMFCPRCQIPVHCPRCDTFLTFSREQDKLFCTSCGYRHSDISCPDCGGDLEDLGFGIEKAYEVIENSVGINDRMSFETFPRWEESFDRVVVLSADSILSVPSYRSEEEMFLYLMRAYRIASKQLIIQTMFPSIPAVKGLTKRGIFYECELKRRQREKLPPFWRTAIIKTAKGDLDSYIAKVVSPEVSRIFNYSSGTYDLLVRFRGRRSLKQLAEVIRRFSKDIIEVRVDPRI